ncbi:hypothetical protein KQI86_13790 [Clostridium sp. MSJ-11]|uniref:Secreted protein n=1 Tax=Clostridium mobile TaxID=2841512 RepID=A0ABS6EK48_9CLOT|nr:hypothetical protein [Clostridium mobile]MBU5485390.1 hypothetical protein [Clostridium mobile]
MGKPSIFSKDYEKKMKKRRIRIIGTFLAILFIVVGAWFYRRADIKNILSKNKINTEKNKEDNKKTLTTDNGDKNKENKESKEEIKKEEGYDFKLSDGENLKVIYEINDKDKKFKYIHPLDSKTIYDISPSAKLMTIYDPKVQRIYRMNIEGKVEDITNPRYTSTNGEFSITREEHLKANPDYIWCSSPKFIDENNIAYVSQLPWFNRSKQYIWIVNLQNNTHRYVQNVEGNDIKLDRLNEEGLGIIVDGEKATLKPSGELIK